MLGASFSDAGLLDAPWQVTWDFGDGSPVETFETDTQGAISASHNYAAAGVFMARIFVQDKDGGLNVAGMRVTITKPVNQPPTANSGSDQTVRLGSLVTLNGSASSDPDNGPSPLRFAWSQSVGSTVTLTNPTAATPSFTPSKIGGYTFDLVVNDGEASSAIDSVTISVVYNFTGFFSPVDNPPIQNEVKAGSAVPLKFSLAGNQGLDILAAGYPKTQSISCSSTTPIGAIEEADTAGNSGLSYDAASNQYKYVWKTTKSWKGTCRQLIVKLNDGSEHKANFIFK
jgi:hypothetical protein